MSGPELSVNLPSPHRNVDYWTDSRRPLASLVFLLPLLAAYELGVHLMGVDQISGVRNGADTWMRGWLLQVGLDRPWALPLLIVGALLTWHLLARFPWRTSVETIIGMGAESLLGAILLLLLGQVLNLSLRHFGTMPWTGVSASVSPTATAIGFIGAGVYEEVLFRLLLLPGIFVFLRLLMLSRRTAGGLSVLVTSAVFALAHYLEPTGGTFVFSPAAFVTAAELVIESPELWFGCCFRWLAGVVFAALFLLRGFGITVGCHVLYDLLVGVLMTTHTS